MKPLQFMLLAGEPSGDLLAAELVKALKQSPQIQAMPFPPVFFGAGGPNMADEGVGLALDLTRHSVIGLSDALKKYWEFKRILDCLFALALEREPDVIICVDFSGFNRRFAHAIKNHVRAHRGSFNNWAPKFVQYISPQVWASRPGRAYQMARDFDLLLSVFPFEKQWYATQVPQLRVEFVGHPLVDRYGKAGCGMRDAEFANRAAQGTDAHTPARSLSTPLIVLLPGSRVGELKRHLPVMVDAVKRIASARPIRPLMVLPSGEFTDTASFCRAQLGDIQIGIGGLADALQKATIGIASTGTVTLECAYFGVPTVALYKTSWSNYVIARQIVTVPYLAMPNLLAGEELYPEFIQHRATGENIARSALELLNDPKRRQCVKAKLEKVVESLGPPGASERAASAVLGLLEEQALSIRADLSRASISGSWRKR